ncbi:MAG: hypothetical protein K6E21_04560 [Bacilli bacterium]|nr:hypothetical protein [Bacilli bacterium]
MKKEDITGTIVYLLILGLGAIFIFTVLRDRSGASGLGDIYWLFNLGALVAGVIFNAILFEAAHILGALIGGYSIVSVTILGLCFKKDAGKWKFCFSSYNGLTGETKIVPKENRNKPSNPYAYLLFGSLLFVLEVIGVMIVFSMYRKELGGLGNVAYFLLTMGATGLMIFVYNILPFKLDSMTDGYRLTKVTNPKNREAFNELLKVEYDISQGKEVDVKVFKEITNYTADLNLNKVYSLLDAKKYDEAVVLLDDIINARENVSRHVYIRAKAQKVYIHLMNDDIEAAMTYYDNEVPVSERREIADDNAMACIRAYILMAGLLDKSRSEVVIAINKVDKAIKKTPSNRKPIETQLFNDALKKVNNLHPKWELDKYYLEEVAVEKKEEEKENSDH